VYWGRFYIGFCISVNGKFYNVHSFGRWVGENKGRCAILSIAYLAAKPWFLAVGKKYLDPVAWISLTSNASPVAYLGAFRYKKGAPLDKGAKILAGQELLSD
jgi:hypothetical protein